MKKYWLDTEVQIILRSPWSSVCLDQINNSCKCKTRDSSECKGAPFLHYDNYFTSKFREMMWKGIEPNLKVVAHQLQFNPKKFRVALHVRRGDVQQSKNGNRYVPNTYYTNIVNTIKKYTDADIHLFSQGDASAFKDLSILGVKLHLDTATDIAWPTNSWSLYRFLIFSK